MGWGRVGICIFEIVLDDVDVVCLGIKFRELLDVINVIFIVLVGFLVYFLIGVCFFFSGRVYVGYFYYFVGVCWWLCF